jgi:hypothetical protein
MPESGSLCLSVNPAGHARGCASAARFAAGAGSAAHTTTGQKAKTPKLALASSAAHFEENRMTKLLLPAQPGSKTRSQTIWGGLQSIFHPCDQADLILAGFGEKAAAIVVRMHERFTARPVFVVV